MSGSSRIAQARAILWRDLLMELRSPYELGAASAFALLTGALAGYAASRYALDPGEQALTLAPALVIALIFLGVFTATTSFVREADKGTLDGLRAQPIPPSVIFASKLVFSLILLEILGAILVLSAWFFGSIPSSNGLWLLAVSAATGLYMAAVASLASAIAVYVEARGILMPAIIIALSAPLVQMATSIAIGGNYSDIAILLLSGIGFTGLVMLLADYVL